MSWVTVIWFMTASACLTLVRMRLLAWYTGWPTGANFALFLGLAAVSFLHSIETQTAAATFRSNPDYLIDTWQTEDGLPENSATSMVQSHDGYLWFGTFNGLVRFDGVKFTVFNPANTPELPSASIINLHLDRNGRLWVSTERGLVMREDEHWRSFGTNSGWAGNYVRTFVERANGDLLLTTFDGHVLGFVKGRFSELPVPPGATGAGYLGWVDESGQWWVVQNQFIGRWDGSRWVPVLSSPDVPLQVGMPVGFAPARDGGLWLLLNTELRKYSHGKEVSRRQVPNNAEGTLGSVSSMSEDSIGNVWISTYEAGLTQVLPNGVVRRWYEPNGISYSDVRFVFEDREKNLWVGTSGGGLMRFKSRRFQSFAGTSQAPLRVVNSVWPAPAGGVWVATYGRGLFRMDEKGNTEMWPDDGPQNDRFYQSVLSDELGRTWVGKFAEGLHVFDGKASRQIPEEQSGGKNVAALFKDSQGRVWISGGRGISVFSAGVFRVFGSEQGLPPSAVCGIGEDRDGRIWASNLDGVFRLEKDRFVEVMHGGGRPLREIACLKGDSDGSMWMGSLSAGLLRWHEGSLATMGAEAGFPVRSVQGILEDDEGYFWMASNRGVVRVERKQLQSVADGVGSSLICQLLDLSDGLPSVECPSHRQPVCARDESGRLWFATLKGVAMIDPAQFRLNTMPPPVQIEEIVYRLGPQSGASERIERRLGVHFPHGLDLPAGSGWIEIHFTAPSFVAPEKVRFEIKLDDEGAAWQDVGNRRMVYFYELKPGPHMFRVRAANNDGVWNETGASLAFSIQPFFWQTIWFRLGASIMLLAIGGGAVWWIASNRIKSEKRFRLAVEASPNGIVLVNDRGRIVLVNAETEKLFGYTSEELIGKDVEMLVPETSRGAHPGHRTGFFTAPQSRAMGAGRELFARRKDGTEFPVEIGLRPIPSAEGLLVLTAIVDVTARKRSELEILQQRNQLAHLSRVNMLGELAGSLAHELNQPLTAVLSNAQAAQRFLAHQPVDLNEVRDILADIVSEDKRAGEVIRRLRLLLKQGEVQHQPLNVNEVVLEVLKLVRSDLVNQNCTAQTELAQHLPILQGDRVQLQQVLLNLVMNGCDAITAAARDNRQLTIRTSQDEDRFVHIAVVDSGAGIAPEKLEQVFEPFYTTKPHGLGLGLAVCRTIITAHGGNLWATNNPGRGATFHFTLPVEKKEQGSGFGVQRSGARKEK